MNINHLEVTHSFHGKIKLIIAETSSSKIPNAFLAMYNSEQFELTGKVFPTNCDSNLNFTIREQAFNEEKLGKVKISTYVNNKFKNGFGNLNVPDNIKFQLLELYGKVPSRFNTNFIYKCKARESNFSTDIAAGAKSSVYPPKYHIWSGIIGKGYDFILVITK